ncbi:PREDICTED: dnaJ homolog subfamily C member 13 [Thamnophis sirtalis]|uniref:DnaJ homolog subfamily C member 13 n=1 Tax=Thamnophis sirtalis TaxID=35019 RepID=A0A6I9YHK8_9SAUR|nr:PREDICTED: dnaJ homolog subfamily C member 13 [Thamnophis sirtalis]
MISAAISRGVDAELLRRAQPPRATVVHAGPDPQPVQGDSSILQTDPPSPLPSVYSEESALVEEGEVIDREFSDDEGLPLDQPTAPGLFRHSLFKSLLYKAKTTTHMGEAASKDSTAVGLDATERLFTEQVALQDVIPSPKLFLDLIQKQWDQLTAVNPPSNGDRKVYTSTPELEALLQFPTVDAPIAALASPALIPSEISEGLKAEDRKAETVIRKTHQAAAWALRSATAASFFNRTSLVWLKQLQSRLAPEEARLHQDITKLMAALEFAADATLSAAKFVSLALVSNVASRRLLWLRHWQADVKSMWHLASMPFKGSALFGSVLDPILIETRDKRKVLPSTGDRAHRRQQPYNRRQLGTLDSPLLPMFPTTIGVSPSHRIAARIERPPGIWVASRIRRSPRLGGSFVEPETGPFGEDSDRTGGGAVGCTDVVQTSLVRTPHAPVSLVAVEDSGQPDPAQPGGSHPSEPPAPTVSRVARERAILTDLHYSSQVIDTIQAARHPSTTCIYEATWQAFCRWYRHTGADPIKASVPQVLDFLQSGLNKGLTRNTLRRQVTALSTVVGGGQGRSLSQHSRVKAFLKGATNLRPPTVHCYPTWNLTLVLRALTSAPFEPIQSISLRLLTLKTVFLVAITSARRVSELAVLSVRADLCIFHPNRVVLRLDPSFRRSIRCSTGLRSSSFRTSARTRPIPKSASGTIWMFIEPSDVMLSARPRSEDQGLFVSFQPSSMGQKVSSHTIGQWLKACIALAYDSQSQPVPRRIMPHSTRSAATTAAWATQASVEICRAATWASPSPFIRHYKVDAKGQDIVQRSILGHILPEAMVCYLENYEPEKFSEIFLGEFDTPEAIWSNEMRRLMIEKIAAHLADFTPRLQSNTRALYQYCPIPVISYPQLENELFCNIYYLRHLCDKLRFPDWPIKDPVKLLKDTLETWRKEVEKKAPTMSIDDAYEVLNLPKGQGLHDESKIRKAYFKLAQKYHPDKNPEGRDMFEKVNKGYEFLCTKSSKIVDGPDPENIILILKTQSILFNRHREDLKPYKYAGYPMLIKTIIIETSDNLLFSKESPLLPAAAELAFYTVNCSALNAEELRRENGIEVLQEAFNRCVAVLTRSSKPEDMSVQVCGHISKCYSVAAQFEDCREKITEMPNIIKDLCRVLYYGKNIPRVASIGVECVSSFAVDYWLQTHLFQAGVLWYLLGYLFNYDYTLEESGIKKSEDSNQQEVANTLAKLSLLALSRLGGYLSEEQTTPENPAIRKSLGVLLTPYITRKLAVVSPAEILKMLNSNTESPYLIWNNRTRIELLEFLESQQESMIKTGECDKSYGSEFIFSDHAKELIVGEIFVRVYNEVPTFQLELPKAFAASLLDYVGSQAQYLHTLMAITQTGKVESNQHGERLRRVEMALEALRNVIKHNPGSECECIGHFKLLFSLLRVHGAGQVQQLALEVVNIVTSNQDCVNNIAEAMVLSNLLALLHSLPSSRQLVLETLYALTSSTKIVKEAMQKGALIYLLDMFCNSTHPQVRSQTAELFAKMTTDKLVGPKVRIILMKFLPGVFMDAMRDNPEAAVHIFEGTHENPELIWNDNSREKVSTTVREMMLEHFKLQKDNPDINWKLPEDFAVIYGEAEGELSVGGVFLRIFIAQPAWVLRKPREFLIALLEKFTELLEKNNPHGETLETITTATVCLFSAQPQLADQVPPLGHLPKILQAMNHKNNAIPKSAMRVIHILSDNELCVRSMAMLETICPLMNGMKKRSDNVGIACEALNRMFQKEQNDLVVQALKADLVPYLLKLLEGVGLENLESPSATKAQIVKALKSMTRSLQYGEQVNEILSQSSIWSAFKDQKHDLFISETQTAGYITGPGVAGYLTAGRPSPVMPNVPPPVDHEAGDIG